MPKELLNRLTGIWESSSAIEEIAYMLRQNADNAEQANNWQNGLLRESRMQKIPLKTKVLKPIAAIKTKASVVPVTRFSREKGGPREVSPDKIIPLYYKDKFKNF